MSFRRRGGDGRNRGYRGNPPRDPRHRPNYGPRNEPLPAMPSYAAGADPRPQERGRKRQRGFQIDESGVQRKYVPGGRIKKNKKPREHEPAGIDLYCEICEYALPDGAAKASHDRGRKHLKRMQEKREEEEEENKPASTTIVKTETPDADVMLKAAREFKDIDKDPNVPKSFKQWATMSLQEAERNPERQVGAVRREVVYTYWHSKDTGNLLSTTWDAMPPANGLRYKEMNPSILPEVVFSGSQVEKLFNVAPVRETPPKPPGAPVMAVNMHPVPEQREKEPAQATEEATPGTPALATFRKAKITWKLSLSARKLLNRHASDEQANVLRLFSKRYHDIAPPKPEAVHEAKDESSTEKASATLQSIKQMDEGQEQELYKLIASTGELGRAQYRIKQEALFMLVGILLESFDFANAIKAMRELRATYKFALGTLESCSESAAHWLVSLLFRPAPDGPLDTALAEVPEFLRNTAGFRYGLRVLRTVLHGEYTQFTCRIFSDSIHDEFNGKSRYLLTPLLETLRMRAILMIGRRSPATQSKVFQNSPVILSHVLNWLGYEEDGEILWDDAKNDFEQAGIQVIPVKGADPNNLKPDGSDRFLSFCNKPTVWRPNEVINSELIFGFLNNKNSVLPYDDQKLVPEGI